MLQSIPFPIFKAVGPERIELEISICMQGLGLSLVNDYKQIEVAYLGVRR